MVKIIIDKDFEHLRNTIEKIAYEGIPENAAIIYDGGRNKVYTYNNGTVTINIKAFKIPSFANSIIYSTIRPSKAKRSFDFAHMLTKKGFNTPAPIAYIEEKDGLRLKHSYYISLQIQASTVRNWDEIPDNENMLRALAREMVLLHKAGVYHRDFSPGNILYQKDEKGIYKFYFVDLNRMTFNIHSHSTLMNNFKSISLDERQVEHLARLYAIEAKLDVEKTIHEALLKLSAYKKNKRIHRSLKKLIGK